MNMEYLELDRSRIITKPLAARKNRVFIEKDRVEPGVAEPRPMTEQQASAMAEVIERIRRAHTAGRPIVIAFGAHTIKNGLGPVLIRLMEEGRLTHLATNGAGIIHDWELAFAGETSEHVADNVARGEFGNWEETGRYINLALDVGASEGRGYGESLGAFIEQEGLQIPDPKDLEARARKEMAQNPEHAASAADLLGVIRRFRLGPGWLGLPHKWKKYSVQAAAFRLGVPFTGHPMIGQDVIYNHPMNHGGALGRAAVRDFLRFANTISRIDGGVYLSVGSAVMSPMIFETSFSMAQNLARQAGGAIKDHFILVVDLADAGWDWSRGEPEEDDPAYYLRCNKTFSRMGGQMRTLAMDNRDFLLHLWRVLNKG